MKERGYITKDFPFLEESIRKTMKSILFETENYWDFTEKLAAIAVNPQVHPNIVYLALYHSSRLSNSLAISNITEAHSNLPLPNPFWAPFDNYYDDDIDDIEESIELNKNDAITFYLLIRLLKTCPNGTPEEDKVRNRIEQFLEENQQLRLHSADYLASIGNRHTILGQPDKSLEYLLKALNLTKESGDKWHQAHLLRTLAHLSFNFADEHGSLMKPKEYFREAMDLFKEINAKSGVASTLQSMCIYAYSRGELGEAFDCQLESVQIQGEIGYVNHGAATNLVGLYLRSGDIASAREWSNVVFERLGWLGPYAYFSTIGLPIAQGNIEEAEIYLDKAHELTISLGDESTLGRYYGYVGRVDTLKGDLESALDNFQRAFEIIERVESKLQQRFCLIELTKTEVGLFTPNENNRDNESSGMWMERLDKEVKNNDIPGISGQMQLLKAELRMKQGRIQEAEEILNSVIDSTDNPATRFLHKDALELRQRWISEGVIPVDAPHFQRRD